MKTNLIALTVASLAAAANAHVHLSVSVNAAGTGLQFLTYGDTTAAVLPDGHYGTVADGQPIVTTLASTAVAAPFTGFVTGASPTLTTDYYSSGLATAPAAWAGADVWLEFQSVTPVSPTTRTDNVIGFSIPAGDFAYQDALTNAAALLDRSIDFGNGNHPHGVSLYSQFAGTYDVKITAHDLRTTGVALADSTPMLLRMTAVPEPTIVAGLGGAALLLRRRRA